MWYVYVLQSAGRNFLYVGSTGDLKRRLFEHHEGQVQSTKAYRPLQLETYIAVRTEERARKLEKYLKVGSGKEILKKRILGNEALA